MASNGQPIPGWVWFAVIFAVGVLIFLKVAR